MNEEIFLWSMKRNAGDSYHMRGDLWDSREKICLIRCPLVTYIHGVVAQIKWYLMEGNMYGEYK